MDRSLDIDAAGCLATAQMCQATKPESSESRTCRCSGDFASHNAPGRRKSRLKSTRTVQEKNSCRSKGAISLTDTPHNAKLWASCHNPFRSFGKSSFLTLMAIVVVVLVCLSRGADAQTFAQASWLDPPRDTADAEGATITIPCAVSDLDGRAIVWQIYRDDGTDDLLFVDDSDFEIATRYRVLSNGNGYNLVITGLTREDDAIFQCTVQRSELKGQARITVQVAPSTPAITYNQSDPLREGDYVKFLCASRDGNPTPDDVAWTRDGVILGGATIVPPTEKFGETRSELVRLIAKRDNGAKYECKVQNDANRGSPVTAQNTLNVQYAPVLDVGQYDPYRVVEGDTITLKCNVDANPPASDIQWYKNDIFRVASDTLVLTTLTSNDAGTYQCRATNYIMSTRQFSLDVLYAPKIQPHFSNGQISGSRVTINEDEKINITCLVDANPAVDMATIEWKRAETVIHRGASYTRDPIKRSDAGDYVCTASNTLRPSGRLEQVTQVPYGIDVRVQYKPGKATITVPTGIVIGNQAVLSCSINDRGDPAAQARWTKFGDSSVIAVGDTLTFPSAQLSDNGQYVCTPNNIVGDGEPDIKTFNVNERPSWLGSPLPAQQVVMKNQSGITARCQARGRPIPDIRWYKDGSPLDQQQGYFRIMTEHQAIDVHSWNVTSLLSWEGFDRQPLDQSLRVEDSGNYTCLVMNDVNQDGMSRNMELIVHYTPEVFTPEDKVAIDTNQSAVLVCQSRATPDPTFTWYNGSLKVTPSARVKVTYAMIGGRYPHQSTLTISDVTTEDLGDYRCEATNQMGANTSTINLTVKTTPDAPTDLRIVAHTWESAELTWTPGFDGGYAQTFVISYTGVGQTPGRVTAGAVTRFNVSDLFPGTNYTFNVFGDNLLGGGAYSQAVSLQTGDFAIIPPTEVEYDRSTRVVTFQSPSSHYCARVETYDGQVWFPYEPCAPPEGSVKISEDVEVQEVRVSLCLDRRPDEICSPHTEADIVEEDLPTSTIIIVAVVCGSVVIILTVILVVLCCRRYRTKQKYQKAEAARPPPPVLTHSNGATSGAPLKPALRNGGAGMVNPGMDHTDNIDFDDQRNNGVFATDTSHQLPPGYYNPSNPNPNGYIGNGAPAQSWKNPNGLPPPSYDNSINDELNRRNRESYSSSGKGHKHINPRDKNYLQLDDPYHPHSHNNSKDSHKDLHKDSDSGVSTPDPQKPKKVIYEVVV